VHGHGDGAYCIFVSLSNRPIGIAEMKRASTIIIFDEVGFVHG
jgi:hypothetical protein